MGSFIKAVIVGFFMMLLMLCFAHHYIGFDIIIDDRLVEPVIGLGAVMLAFLITMAVVGLVIAGIVGSFVLVGGLIAAVLGGVVLFSGMFFSWPVLLGLVVIYLIFSDRPRRRDYDRY